MSEKSTSTITTAATTTVTTTIATEKHAGWSAGASLAALQEMLGHASIVTTQRYARLTDDSVMAEKLRMGRQETAPETRSR